MKRMICVSAIVLCAIGNNHLWAYSGGSGTSSSPYLIANKADLLQLAENIDDYDKYFKMTADIDLAEESFTRAVIAPDTNIEFGFQGTLFTGELDGDWYVIKNLNISSTEDYVALFGQFEGQIKNLGVSNCAIASDRFYVGALCGMILQDGKINNCYSSGSINGLSNVGGLCGMVLKSNISSCYSTCNIRGEFTSGGLCGSNWSGGITNCYSTGNITGKSWSGGFCGNNDEGKINNCYSTGYVTGDSNVGGFCGQNNSGTISSCFWNTSTSGMTSSSGGTGKSTLQMQSEPTFTSAGWNFDNTWGMDGYPILKQLEANILYNNWTKSWNLTANEKRYDYCPAGDSIQNLLKFAIGLDPMTPYSFSDLIQPLIETNHLGIIYNKSKNAKFVELFPKWSSSLNSTNWVINNFEFTQISETSSNETWKAMLLEPSPNLYIKLTAKEK